MLIAEHAPVTMIELRVLGDPQVTWDGTSVALQRKPLAVLTYLALAEARRFVNRDTLLGVFWPDLNQSKARGALRQVLHCLRRELDDDVILTEGDEGVALDHERLRCDVLEFERAIRGGRLRAAVDLYGGPVLGGLHLKGCPEFEHWLDGERGPRERSYERAIEQLARLTASSGEHGRAAEWLRRLVRVDPLRGRFVALLMEALRDAGDREESIRVGERYVKDLAREWKAAPDPAVGQLLEVLRSPPASSPPPRMTRGDPLRCELDMVREVFAGRYEIVEELGGGVLTKVFLARDPRLRREIVVKVLKPEMRENIEAERFRREIAIVAEFNHPNVVPLFESDEIGGFLYYTMRHIPGSSLRARLQREGYLPIEDAVGIACDVAKGLQYAHDRQIAHRDLNPKNILLHEGTTLISDFGTVIVLQAGGKRLTAAGVVMGTAEYMSPEQGVPGGKVDARTDVYGLGCVLFEMLAGEPVFTGPTRPAVIAKHQRERVPSIRIVRSSVPKSLQDVVMRALAKAPGDRFKSTHAFADALRTF